MPTPTYFVQHFPWRGGFWHNYMAPLFHHKTTSPPTCAERAWRNMSWVGTIAYWICISLINFFIVAFSRFHPSSQTSRQDMASHQYSMSVFTKATTNESAWSYPNPAMVLNSASYALLLKPRSYDTHHALSGLLLITNSNTKCVSLRCYLSVLMSLIWG